MVTRLEMPSIPAIQAIQRGAKDKILLCSVGEYAELAQRHCQEYIRMSDSYSKAADGLVNGNEEMVSESEAFLSKFENADFLAPQWRNVSDMVGGMPDVPSYLSGNPMNMRRRQRVMAESAPLSIFMELTASSGFTRHERIQRGAAMLALVRMLQTNRAIELWTCITYGAPELLQMIAVKIDTSPLDLGRAAHLLCEPNCGDLFGSIISEKEMGDFRTMGSNGWAYAVPELERKYSGEILTRVVHPGSKTIFVPAALLGKDPMADPEKWLRDMLHQYGGIEAEETASES